MYEQVKAALVQMHVEDKLRNIVTESLSKAAEQNIDMAVLPEMFNCPTKPPTSPVRRRRGGECYGMLSRWQIHMEFT